jgi:hypothetical protein
MLAKINFVFATASFLYNANDIEHITVVGRESIQWKPVSGGDMKTQTWAIRCLVYE